METITVSKWLAENLDSHAIVNSTAMKKRFEQDTGIKAEWRDHSKAIMRAMINNRGKGGELYGKKNARYVGALEIAEWCAGKFLGPQYHHGKLGMGFAFRQCIEDLKKAGY